MIDRHLGKTVEYIDIYNPDILVKEARIGNRESQNITAPFNGFDIWNIYEISFVLNNGFPINGVGKLVYSSANDHIVESKALKLYFFSFNTTALGSTVEEAINELSKRVTNDLTNLLGTDVQFTFVQEADSYINVDSLLSTTYNLDVQLIDIMLPHINYKHEKENINLLQVLTGDSTALLKTSCMRSNCKITNQPDWADVFVYYKSNRTLELHSLLQYIISFRHENHFHEECIEMIYDRLYMVLEPEELLVFGMYTRRGGIDINPVRSNVEIPPALIGNHLLQKTLRQ